MRAHDNWLRLLSWCATTLTAGLRALADLAGNLARRWQQMRAITPPSETRSGDSILERLWQRRKRRPLRFALDPDLVRGFKWLRRDKQAAVEGPGLILTLHRKTDDNGAHADAAPCTAPKKDGHTAAS